MKHVLPSLFLLCCLPAVALAQDLSLNLTIEDDTYLPFEDVTARLEIRNLTNQAVVFQPNDRGTGRIYFEIIGGDRHPVVEREAVVQERIVIRPRQVVTLQVNLHRHYRIAESDQYIVRASVRYKSTAYTTGRRFFVMTEGREVAAFRSRDPDREFSFRVVIKNQVQQLMLRLRDRRQTTSYGVINLGRYMNGLRPRTFLDSRNRVHLLHRATPKVLLHNVFSATGRHLSVQQFRSWNGDNVNIVERSDGSVVISGAEPVSEKLTAREP